MRDVVSKDKTLEVRKAKFTHKCHGLGRDWQSSDCRGIVKPGEIYVASVLVDSRGHWERDSVAFCLPCALARLKGRVELIEAEATMLSA